MAEDNEEQSPFTRRGFVAATVVIALIVVLGLVIVIVNMNRDDPDPAPPTSTSTTTAAPTSEPPEAVGGASVCGLPAGQSDTTRLTSAPDVDEWQYQGTVAYPVSDEFGPAETDPAGFRYCFQRSPEGALFAATYAVTVGTDQAVVPEWIKYFTAPGPYREQLIQPPTTSSEPSDVRLRVAGFRLLSYDGDSARVDIAMVASVSGQTVNMSAVYPLVWSDGDWKVSTDTPEPGSVASIPDLAGYIVWGE